MDATTDLLRAVAAELAAGAGALEELGAALCADAAVAAAHPHRLQAFDALAQAQRELAALLARLADGDAPAAAVAALGLESLQRRLPGARAAAAGPVGLPEEVWA